MTDYMNPNNDNDSNEKLLPILPIQKTPNPHLDNDISKLMYYLNCVNMVIQVNIYHKFIDYLNFDNISKEDEEIILNLALKYKPKILIDNGVFILNQNLLQGSSSNEFYQLNDQRIETKVNPDIVVEGNQIFVSQVMACDYGWISTYYHEPIERINKAKLNNVNVSYQQPAINANNNMNNNGNLVPFQIKEPQNTNNKALDINARNNNNTAQNYHNECCSAEDCVKCIIFIVVIIGGIIYGAAKSS